MIVMRKWNCFILQSSLLSNTNRGCVLHGHANDWIAVQKIAQSWNRYSQGRVRYLNKWLYVKTNTIQLFTLKIKRTYLWTICVYSRCVFFYSVNTQIIAFKIWFHYVCVYERWPVRRVKEATIRIVNANETHVLFNFINNQRLAVAKPNSMYECTTHKTTIDCNISVNRNNLTNTHSAQCQYRVCRLHHIVSKYFGSIESWLRLLCTTHIRSHLV